MPGILDHIAFLSQQVGPRPAGTEEEQQAALYITEQLQQEAGLSAVIEDFNSESSEDLIYAISAFATIVFTVLALFIPVMAIPALVVTALTAIVYGLEAFGKPLFTSVRARGVSQNVVAKYEPGFSAESGGARRRKIILVANYDSGKVRPELNSPFLKALPVLQKVSLGAMIFIPLLLLVRFFFFLHAEGTIAIVLNTLTVIALIFVALPVIFAAAHKLSAYNEGANSNASGVAALLEIARAIGQGSIRSARVDEQGKPVVYGEEAARSAGLVPEGAQLVYEASQVKGPDLPPQTEEDRLSAAKNAIAAMTGAAVSSPAPASLADNLVQVRDETFEEPSYDEIRDIREDTKEAFTSPVFEDAQENVLPEEGDAEELKETVQQQSAPSDVPDWFRKAQEKANKKEEKKPADIQRSRYADALDAAVAESSTYFSQASQVVTSDVEDRLQKMRDEIMETSAPLADRVSFAEVQNKGFEALQETQQPAASDEQNQQQTGEINLGSTTAMPPINIDELSSFGEQRNAETAPAVENLAKPLADEPKNSPIVLPDIALTEAKLPPISKAGKQQRAPLAVSDEEGESQNTAKSLLNMLPAIDLTAGAAEEEFLEGQTKEKPNLKETLPSLSGVIKAQKEQAEELGFSEQDPGTTGAVVTAGVTGVFSPVGEELLENVAPEDMYVDDADDSAYDGALTETGAFAGPGYVDMPKSRARKIFGKFGRKKKNEEDIATPQEWLAVDDDFDARNVGAERGGWESFQESQDLEEEPEYYNDNAAWDDDSWEGGAFSKKRSEQDSGAFGEEEFFEESGESRPEASSYQEAEMRQIQNFRHPDFNTEIWFVAVGSELAGNGGMKAFIAEHEQELRGSIIVNVSSLGAGDLCFAETEGMYKAKKISSRMKRFIGKASQATGVPVRPTSLRWKNSAASVALNQGFQAMSIFGMQDEKPAYFGQGDDVLENVEGETLQKNIDFIMELLRNI